MNIDKTKVVRYASLSIFLLGVVNMILTHYSIVLITDEELDFWSNIVSLVSGAIFGVTVNSETIKNLFKGKSGL